MITFATVILRTTMQRKKFIFCGLLLLAVGCWLLPTSLWAQETTNSRQARQLFDKTFQMVFGPQGSTLHYAVNIIGIYKTEGTVWYKGRKLRYSEARYASWNDGTTAYMIDHKKKTVGIYKANSDKKDKYLSKFKFKPSDYTYSWAADKSGIVVSIKANHFGLTGIREVRAILDKTTHAPVSLRIKVSFFWTTVNITHFKSGDIVDSTFVFPRDKFRSYEFSDHRNDD
jgi:hypothetical protein